MNATPHPSPGRLRRALLCVLLSLPLCAVLTPAQARGGGDFRGHRAAFRAPGPRPMERVQRQPGPRAQQQQQPAAERVQPKPAAAPGPVEAQGRPALPVETQPAESSKPGKLTPDERRALRQQINEAGRDIYRPVRP